MGARARTRSVALPVGPAGRLLVVAFAAALTGLVVLGITAAAADSHDTVGGNSPEQLLERLDALENDLPDDGPVSEVLLDDEVTWGEVVGDATGVRSTLDTLEPDLRALFIDADEADGAVADAVAEVSRGWLDLWQGAASIATAEGHDLDFPVETTDDMGVATGADELRGAIEVGVELALAGHARHLAGYVELRELGEADPGAQTRFDERAEAAEAYDAEIRPRAVLLLSQQTTSVLVPVARFASSAPGVESRAASVEVVCVDRQALEELGGVVTDEVLEQLESVERDDCPDLPGPLED